MRVTFVYCRFLCLSLLPRWVSGCSDCPKRNDTGLFLLLQLPLCYDSNGETGRPEAWMYPVWGTQDVGACSDSLSDPGTIRPIYALTALTSGDNTILLFCIAHWALGSYCDNTKVSWLRLKCLLCWHSRRNVDIEITVSLNERQAFLTEMIFRRKPPLAHPHVKF